MPSEEQILTSDMQSQASIKGKPIVAVVFLAANGSATGSRLFRRVLPSTPSMIFSRCGSFHCSSFSS